MNAPDIKSQTRDELLALAGEWGLPGYRVDQLLGWVYDRRVTSWAAMSNLPLPLREQLAARFSIHAAELVRLQGARDATRKFLWRLRDQALIESVLIPASPALYGDPSDRHTLCVSSQVGCAYGCAFCASGLAGWKRNLSADEIVEQVLATERWHAAQPPQEPAEAPVQPGEDLTQKASPSGPDRLVNNLVVMGMGEPLANYDNLLRALRILNAPWGGSIGARKITVSTSGLVPEIRQLAEEPMQVRLAISLHAASDEVRGRIMPVNRKYPLAELVAVCEHYQRRKGRMITFEYILIAGINDDPAEARRLAPLARRLHAKVNLIPYNRVEGLPWNRPSESAQQAFLSEITRLGANATLRTEKGEDIDAACGQLRLRTKKELGSRP